MPLHDQLCFDCVPRFTILHAPTMESTCSLLVARTAQSSCGMSIQREFISISFSSMLFRQLKRDFVSVTISVLS